LNVAQIKPHERLLEERRKLGAFYTPERLSLILSRWAIRKADDTVLEPSFGGCGFLETARERLAEVGNKRPREQIFGCDIDPIAFEHLASVLGSPVDLDRFVQADFLDVQEPSGWPPKFATILANPPYIPYQLLGKDRRRSLSKRNWPIKDVGGRASLWAYFIAHSVSFLDTDGRMAWVLPGAFLQADYAKSIRKYLSTHFERAAAIVLRERIFLEAGTEEETVILLADGHLRTSSARGIELGEASSVVELTHLIESWEADSWHGRPADQRPASLSLRNTDQLAFESVDNAPCCRVLGDVATIQIGLVTGANEFFVLNKTDQTLAGLQDSDCTPIMAKFHAAKGIIFRRNDYVEYVDTGGRGYLISSDEATTHGRVKTYLRTFDEERRKSISTFKKRKVWSQPDDGKVPDAFFPVMHHFGPRLVLNPDRCTCTNTIHRVYFKDGSTEHRRKLIAISLLTSFSQLSAELVGRRYGSGVLKHEPREAERIRILLPTISSAVLGRAFKRIDCVLRDGNRDHATAVADALIYQAAKISDWQETANTLGRSLSNIRGRRRRPQPSAQGKPI
jgi:adenine-specific DNA-methyltransferase